METLYLTLNSLNHWFVFLVNKGHKKKLGTQQRGLLKINILKIFHMCEHGVSHQGSQGKHAPYGAPAWAETLDWAPDL